MASRVRAPPKASAPCTRCLERKTTCNRALPHCSRCAITPAYCRYDLCGVARTRRLNQVVRAQGSMTSLAMLEDSTASNAVIRLDDSPPPASRPLSQWGPCGWDLTEHGQTELMHAMLVYHYPMFPDQLSQGKLKRTVDIILQERGCSLETLLEDEVFESFPLVQYDRLEEYAVEDRGLSMPGLILAILLITTPPCNHITCSQTKRLYLIIIAFLPILQSQLNRHNGVLLIQALVAIYEYGHGLYEKSHFSLNSAICVASRIELDFSRLELSLEWRLCLMQLDCMLALATLYRDPGWLPLICNSDNTMARAVGDYLPMLRTPEETTRPSEVVQNILSMGQVVSITASALQHIHNSRQNPQSARQGCDIIGHKILLALNAALQESRTDVDHCSILASCSLLLRTQISQSLLPGQVLGPEEWMAGHACRQIAWILIKDVFSPCADDGRLTESLLSIMPSMHSLYLITNDLDGVTTVEEIAALMPYIRQAAKRWTGLRPIANRIARNLGLNSHIRAKYDAFGDRLYL